MFYGWLREVGVHHTDNYTQEIWFGVYICVCVHVRTCMCTWSMTFGHSASIHDKFSTLICLLYADYRLSYTTDEWTFHFITQWHSKTEPWTVFCVYKMPEWPIPVATWYEAWVCDRALAVIVGSNPARGVDVCLCCECCVMSGRGLCDGLITYPEEFYRLWCV
jgi:hypothetical protein